jgi:dihydroorotate dehydrogenase
VSPTFRGRLPIAARAPSVLPYRLLRPVLFSLAPEAAHEFGSHALSLALGSATARRRARRHFLVDAPELRIARWGIEFPNPVGLAAGFDKAGALFNALGALGFGHVEIGTVTAHAQPGNPRPRLFRLPADGALLNRMGFNNPGAEAVAERLSVGAIEPVLGINLGKSKVTPLEQATADYLRSFELLAPFARYVVINVSSPNTPGLRQLQDAKPLRQLIATLRDRARSVAAEGSGRVLPVLVKIAPDLSDAQVDEAVEIALEEGAAGMIATNTTVSRAGLRTPAARVAALGAGGISGAPLARRADEVVRRIYRRAGQALPVIGVGGISTAEDAWRRIRAGASLVQVYTGFVYHGPSIARDLNRGLLRRLRRDGHASLDAIVGSDA